MEGAPISTLQLVAVALSSLLLGSTKPELGADWTLLRQGRVFRLATQQWVMHDQWYVILLACLLLSNAKHLERQWGSSRYLMYLIIVTGLATISQWQCLFWLGEMGSKLDIPSGPYALLFANLTIMLREFDWFPGRAAMVFTSLLLVYISQAGSLVPLVCGLLAGWLYSIGPLGMHNWAVPLDWIGWEGSRPGETPAIRISGQIVRGGLGPATTLDEERGRANGMLPNQAGQGGAYQTRSRPITFQPDPTALAQLTAAGFPEGAARTALQRANNDIHVASNLLLEMT